MAVIHAYYCPTCDKEMYEQWEPPVCCKAEMRILFWKPTFTTEWGSARQYVHLRDEPFGSRGELERYKRDNNLELAPSADKHHGARNDELLKPRKKYSYAGSPKS